MNGRYTLIVLAVFLALVVVAVQLKRSDRKPQELGEPTTTATPMPLLSLVPAEIQEVVVQGPTSSVTLKRSAGGWDVDGQPADESVGGVIDRVASPAVLRELPADRKPEDYGFAALSMTVTMKMQDGTESVLEVGDNTPAESNVFVRIKGQTRIVVVSNFDFETMKGWLTTKPFAPTPTVEGALPAGTPYPGGEVITDTISLGTPADATAEPTGELATPSPAAPTAATPASTTTAGAPATASPAGTRPPGTSVPIITPVLTPTQGTG